MKNYAAKGKRREYGFYIYYDESSDKIHCGKMQMGDNITSACHKLLDPLGFCTWVIISVTFEKVYNVHLYARQVYLVQILDIAIFDFLMSFYSFYLQLYQYKPQVLSLIHI